MVLNFKARLSRQAALGIAGAWKEAPPVSRHLSTWHWTSGS